MQLYQYETGYRYNSDTLLLYDFIAACHPKGSILDVGCGCGILGLLLKRDFPETSMTLLDIQEANMILSERNAGLNSLHVGFIHGNFTETSFSDKFDWIVSNPPFYHQGVVKSQNESLFLSRHGSALPFGTLAHKVTKNLSNRGYFCFCYDAKQLDMLMQELQKAKLNVEEICFVHPSYDKESSLVLIRARKNSKTLCKVRPPIILYENDRFTPRVAHIFEKSQTKSLAWQN